jgi:dGTP triphosphohydrolase
MSLTNDPDNLTQGGNPADSKDSAKEAIADLNHKMELGFVEIRQEMRVGFADLRGDIGKIDERTKDIDSKIDNKIAQQTEKIATIIDDKISKQTERIDTKLDQRCSTIETKLDQRCNTIEAKIDFLAKEVSIEIKSLTKEVSILQNRVNSSEADRSRLIAGLIGGVITALIIFTIQKFLPSEPPRNPTNRSAIEYIP